VTEYELVPLFDRTPGGAANGIILFNIYYRGVFVGCQHTWAQASAYVDFLQSNDDLFLKASKSPFSMMTIYENRREPVKIDYSLHPTDNSLVVGRNGHTYAAAYLPERAWQFEEAWGILDQLKPDSIQINVRLWLAGMIAGALDRVARERSVSAFDLRG
jgi:hypothetical protein